MTSPPLRIVQPRLPLRDPHDCTDAADELTLYEAFFDTLVRREGTRFVPRLAREWSVSDDAMTWHFRLRGDARFHDGSPCDAEAVVASLRRMARPDKGYTLGAPGVWNQYLGTADISALDAGTVRVVLNEPLADLLDILVQGYIVAPASIAALDAGDTSRPVGTGAYRLVEATNGRIVAEADPHHFGTTPVNGAVEWRAVPASAERLALLLAHEVDVATGLDFHASRALEGGPFTRVETLAPVAIIYLLNAARGPLSDPLIRRALALTIDRADLIHKAVAGAARPLHGFVSPNHFGAATSDAPQRDVERARALMAQAGHAGGLTLGLDCPTRLPDEAERLTAALAAQLRAIGVTLDVHLHADREAYAHMVRRKEIRDLCVFDSSPLSTFRVLHEKLDARVRGSWWQGYHNAAVEACIDAGRRQVDDAARAGSYACAYREMQRDPAWLTLYNPLKVTGLAGSHPSFSLPVDGVLDVARLPARGDDDG